jgi:hypothetical protein
MPLMEWQRQVAEVALELLPDGKPAYRKVIVTVPRQNGKTSLLLALMCHRAVNWGQPQHIGYTAQDGSAARKKLIQELLPIMRKSKLWKLGRRGYEGVGDERIIWENGSQIDVVASTSSSGHGRTYDLVFFDEAFDDVDDRREQALIPTMITKPDAQTWVVSTAGDEGSVYLRQQMELGRAAATAWTDEGVAYFEWSAPDDADIDDPETWRACMPALGVTIDEKEVAFTRHSSTEGLFRRSMLNQWTASEERVIPASLWNAVQRQELELDRAAVAFGLDVHPDRETGSIAVADSSQRCQVIEAGRPVGKNENGQTLVERVIELCTKYTGSCVIDGRGPASLFRVQMETAGVKVHEYTASDIAKACARIYDAVADNEIQIQRHEKLDQAAAGASKRVILDSWTWSRSGLSDITPLVALTMAFHQAARAQSVWVFRG